MTSDKLSMALRRNQGRRLLPKFLAEASDSLGKQADAIRLLDLDRTLPIWQACLEMLNRCGRGEVPAFRQTWSAEDHQELIDLAARMRQKVPRLPMLLFRSLSEYCGAIETDSHEILDKLLQLVSLDQEDLVASTEDTSHGIFLGYYTEPYLAGGGEIYSMCIWGPEFLAVKHR